MNQYYMGILAKEIASESVDEMLVAITRGITANLSNNADVPVEYHLSRNLLSPLGDW